MSASDVIDQVSAGGVIARHVDGRIEVCLIARARQGHAAAGTLVWCLPKGHVESGESLAETALREVAEETGLRGRIRESLGTIAYQFVAPEDGRRYAKTVHYFLCDYLDGTPDAHDGEVREARWTSLETAIGQLTYDNERRILVRARALLASTDSTTPRS